MVFTRWVFFFNFLFPHKHSLLLKMILRVKRICPHGNYCLWCLKKLLFILFQSDIVHQSVYELVHSEDREELQRQLMWNSFLPPESANIGLQDVLLPDNCHMLERSFTVRFRCLLDNTSGFLVRLDLRKTHTCWD